MDAYCEGKKYEAFISQAVKLQNKAARIINSVPLREHITLHYVTLGLIKFPDKRVHVNYFMILSWITNQELYSSTHT